RLFTPETPYARMKEIRHAAPVPRDTHPHAHQVGFVDEQNLNPLVGYAPTAGGGFKVFLSLRREPSEPGHRQTTHPPVYREALRRADGGQIRCLLRRLSATRERVGSPNSISLPGMG